MKDIENYEGKYAITEDGKVWSYKSNKFLKPSLDKDGYYKVSLCSNSKYKQFFIHRLVAIAFIPNPENKPTVDHIDGDIKNNNINNLRWATYYEQTENINWKNKRIKPIICIENNIYYEGISDANRKLGLNMAHLSECVRGKRNICGNYHWRYATPEEILAHRGELNGYPEVSL